MLNLVNKWPPHVCSRRSDVFSELIRSGSADWWSGSHEPPPPDALALAPASPRVAEQGGRAQPDAAAATFAYGRADAAAVDDEGGAPAVPSLSSYMASLSRSSCRGPS